MKKNIKWISAFCTFILIGLGMMAALVITVDPFFQYHKPLKQFPYIIENQLCQNPGMAKNFDYDSVLLGSSMIESFNMKWFEEEFGTNTLKLQYNAAHALDQSTILKVIDEHHGELERLFLGIDITTYAHGTNVRAFPIDEYLYDDIIWNDVQYWWNKDVLLNYILLPFLTMEEADDINIAYNKVYLDGLYKEELALNNYKAQNTSSQDTGTGSDEISLENVMNNIKLHILPYIERHPDTEVYVFFPPYSILFWHEQIQNDCVEERLAEYEMIVGLLSEYPNVKMFFFANDESIICNLNNYKDYTHYNREISRQLVETMAKDEGMITKENCEDEIQKLRKTIETFDFTKWGL